MNEQHEVNSVTSDVLFRGEGCCCREAFRESRVTHLESVNLSKALSSQWVGCSSWGNQNLRERGGFRQFFGNSTGVLAPEAVEGFREIGQAEVAALIEKAISLFGSVNPRGRKERQTLLHTGIEKFLDALDEMFYSLIDSEAGGVIAADDRYAATVQQNSSFPQGICV